MYIRYCHCFCAAMSPSTFAECPSCQNGNKRLSFYGKKIMAWIESSSPGIFKDRSFLWPDSGMSCSEWAWKWHQMRANKDPCIINSLSWGWLSSFQRAFEFGYTPMILKAVWLFALSSGLEGFITLQKKYVRKDCTLLQLCFVCFVDRIFSSLSWFTAALKLPY